MGKGESVYVRHSGKKCGIRKLRGGLLKSMQCTLGRTVGEKEGSMNKNEGDSEKSGERTKSDKKR